MNAQTRKETQRISVIVTLCAWARETFSEGLSVPVGAPSYTDLVPVVLGGGVKVVNSLLLGNLVGSGVSPPNNLLLLAFLSLSSNSSPVGSVSIF